MIETEKDITDAKNYAFYLETHSFEEVKTFVTALPRPDYINFWYLFFENCLLREIARHKIILACLLAETCGSIAIDDDRKRIIFAIAGMKDGSLNDINITLAKLFQGTFRLNEKYVISQQVKSWQEIVVRCRQIKNGYENLCYLAVKPQVDNFARLYKGSGEENPETLKKISALAKEILLVMHNYIEYPITIPQLKEIYPKVVDFYRLTNRLELDIEKLKEEVNCEEALIYIVNAEEIADTKIYLTAHGLKTDNYEEAENYIRERSAMLYFYSTLITSSELERAGKPLIRKNQFAAQAAKPSPIIHP
ncbi:MAG: hypothetical protein WC107_00145 [Patescibacteria group bacterium]